MPANSCHEVGRPVGPTPSPPSPTTCPCRVNTLLEQVTRVIEESSMVAVVVIVAMVAMVGKVGKLATAVDRCRQIAVYSKSR